jgi:hypothetical protein
MLRFFVHVLSWISQSVSSVFYVVEGQVQLVSDLGFTKRGATIQLIICQNQAYILPLRGKVMLFRPHHVQICSNKPGQFPRSCSSHDTS